MSTTPGDWVLDSFAGSGTTGAVAHKMGRRWIMVELGEHCHTHIIPRMKKVIDGTDQGGITKAMDWKGGGGFRYFRLAPSLLEKDKWGNWVISKDYNANMLASAMAKHEGFVYNPDETSTGNRESPRKRITSSRQPISLPSSIWTASMKRCNPTKASLSAANHFRRPARADTRISPSKRFPTCSLVVASSEKKITVSTLPTAPPKRGYPTPIPSFGGDGTHPCPSEGGDEKEENIDPTATRTF